MTSPNQEEPVWMELLGLGAFQVGGDGGGNDLGGFGQGVTTDAVTSVIAGPATDLMNLDGVTATSDVITLLANYLTTLPLQALQMFKGFLPGKTDADFADVPTAVATITGAMGLTNVTMTGASFSKWLTDVYNETAAAGAAFWTFLQAISAAVLGFTTWAKLMSDLDDAWATYVAAIDAIDAEETASFSQLLSAVFGIDPSTGQNAQWASLMTQLTALQALISAGDVSSVDWAAWWTTTLEALGAGSTDAVNIGNWLSGNYQAAIDANALAAELQSDFAAGNSAFAALVASWYTTLTTGGQSWSTVLSQLDSAWDTYISANSAVNVATSTTITQIISNFFGFDPTTGLMSPNNVDGLGDSFTQLGAALSGDVADSGTWAWLGQLMNQFYTLLGITHTTAVATANTVAIIDNKPLIYGLDDTTESNIPFTAAVNKINVTSAGGSVWAFVRCSQTDVKNTIAFTASTSSAPTTFVVSLYSVDFVGSTMDYINTSSNFVSQLSSSEKWLFTTAGATSVLPGSVLAIEFQVTGSGSVDVFGQTISGKPTHPTAQLPGAAATRSGTITHANTAFSALVFNNTSIPYTGLETSSPPPPTFPDFPSSFTATGTFTQVVDSWAAHVDIIGIGGGGGGQGETGFTVGRGGSPGAWNAKTLVVGTDIMAGGTLTITVGAGGAGGPYFTDGSAGAATTFSWVDHLGATKTLTCSGGAGGGLGNGANLAESGLSPGNETFNGVPYIGGAAQPLPGVGYPPGGSGPGGPAFLFGYAGGRGQAWTVERQS